MAKTNVVDKPVPPPRHLPEYNRAGKVHNKISRAFLNDAILPENRALRADIERIESGFRDEDRWANKPPQERYEWLDQETANAQLNHWSRCQNRKIEVGKELDKYRDAWRNANKGTDAERIYNLERYKIQIALADEKELMSKVNQAANASTFEEKAAADHDFLLAAAGHFLNQGDKMKAAVAKSALENTNSDRPWLNTERGKRLQDLHDTYDVEFGLVQLDPSVAGDMFSTLELTEIMDV